MQKQHIVIIGANSAIALATARIYAKSGAKFTLLARNAEKLNATHHDLLARGAAEVHILLADLNCSLVDQDLIKQIQFPVDTLLIAHGVLGDQSELASSDQKRLELMQTNLLSTMDILAKLTPAFAQQGFGKIAVISSVAGERGRQSNFYYGASKAALSALCSGHRNALYPKGVHLMTVLPGFVASPMTQHLKQGPLFVSPDRIARDIIHGLKRHRDVLYTPFFWRWIMTVISLIPEKIFKRLKL